MSSSILKTASRTTDFLRKIFEDFFRPRVSYCVVKTWNPQSTQRVEQVNLTASSDNPTTGLGGLQSKYKTSDGTPYGEWEFPNVAPLVSPALN